MRQRWLLPTLLILVSCPALAQQRVSLSGFVNDIGTGEALAGASVSMESSERKQGGTQTNPYGFFSISLPSGVPCTLRVSMLGYETMLIPLTARMNERRDFKLKPHAQNLDEVRVIASEDQPSQSVHMSNFVLSVAQLKQMPMLLGEKDPLKALQFVPGVQQGVEGSSSLFVRGGGSDQNLLLLDNAVVYNANHLFGFFSTFNADAIQRVELFKGAFPSRFGGRLSSVVDIQMKEGNREKLHGEGGIGLLSSRLTLEGPLKKNKASFLISGRRTYADALLGLTQPADSKLLYAFHDFNAKVNASLSARHRVYLSTYWGRDGLRITDRVERSTSTVSYRNVLTWGNVTTSFRWNALWTAKTFSNVTLTHSFYRLSLSDEYEKQHPSNPVSTEMNFVSTVGDWTLRADFDHFYRPGIVLRWGGAYTHYRFVPRTVTYRDSQNDALNVNQTNQAIQNTEGGLYAEAEAHLTERLAATTGVRLSWFGNNTARYVRPEPRVSTAYKLGENTSVKASYSRTNQYVHQLSNTGVGLPTDLWVPASTEVPPQRADQVVLGLHHDWRGRYNLSVETYHKWMQNVVNYREGADFIGIGDDPTASSRYEEQVTNGQGWAYGVETFLQKRTGRFTGWAGYTLAWSLRQFDEINGGKPFYSRQDRRHDLKVLGNYALTKRIHCSANWQFSSGNALSVPVAVYFDGYVSSSNPPPVFYYGQYNGFRAAAYHRLDVGIRFIKLKKWGERSWELSVYNVYNRKNPYYYSVAKLYDEGVRQSFFSLKSRWLLPILPSISYSFKF